MDMVARGFENKLSTLAKSRKNVSGYLDQLRDVKKQSSELLGVEDEEPAVIEVESFGNSGVELNTEQAAAARAAADENGRVKVRQAGTDIIKEINVNPPTEETVEEAPPAPAPRPAESIEDFSVWSTKHLADFPPLAEAEKAVAPTDRRPILERRIEFLKATIEQLPPTDRRASAASKHLKQLREALRTSEDELKNL
jgi:hypothetical protein